MPLNTDIGANGFIVIVSHAMDAIPGGAPTSLLNDVKARAESNISLQREGLGVLGFTFIENNATNKAKVLRALRENLFYLGLDVGSQPLFHIEKKIYLNLTGSLNTAIQDCTDGDFDDVKAASTNISDPTNDEVRDLIIAL